MEKGLTVVGARVATGPLESSQTDLFIHRGRIHSMGKIEPRGTVLDLSNHLILPGLINSHDHLEFNLFPRLGRGVYANATAWARDIYQPSKPPISDHLRVPKAVRLTWGGIKNLVSGVTTVMHHNAYDPAVFEDRFPVRVVKRFAWAHSVDFSPELNERHRETPRGVPFVLHAGEGTDDMAREEIDHLEREGILNSSTIIVHGVALEAAEIRLLKRRQCSLIWCPNSNYFTLGRSISEAVLRSGIPIALGTDSALTSLGDLSDELRIAHTRVDVCRLYRMVTAEAAGILRLKSGEGMIEEGGVADLLVIADHHHTPAESLLSFVPEMVLVAGEVKLISTSLKERLNLSLPPSFRPLCLEGKGLWLIDCDVESLIRNTRAALGSTIHLAGKHVLV